MPSVSRRCEAAQKAIAEDLFKQIGHLHGEANASGLRVLDTKVAEVLDMMRQLAENMRKNAGRPVVWLPESGSSKVGGVGGGARTAPSMPAPRADGLRVTAGGAKDIEFLRKLIAEGRVPPASALVVEGFMSEFNLPLSASACRDLICMTPAVAIDRERSKLYVQVGMDSAVTAQSFQRKPLNLAIVIDISGSMGATDATEKSRLEWAKEAAIHTINQLGPSDTLSIVTFDDIAEVLVTPTTVTDRAAIIARVNTLATRNSTNLEAGLRKGYSLVSSRIAASYENRVIMISDAGLNTGVTDAAALTKLVSEFAGEGIGLTAIGVGDNFNQKFIHEITMSQGGNYLFVQSGKRMLEYFKQFDFLVSPVAYNLKARVVLEGVKAKLAKAYGVPAEKGQPLDELMSIRTLFFTSSGGGALLLEYDLVQ